MKTLIIYESIHHGNTEKVAKVIAATSLLPGQNEQDGRETSDSGLACSHIKPLGLEEWIASLVPAPDLPRPVFGYRGEAHPGDLPDGWYLGNEQDDQGG